jgi:hypothetical protein
VVLKIGVMSTGQQICKNIVKSKLLNIIDTIAPYRRIAISEKHPISNHALRSLENHQQTLHKNMKRSKTDQSIQKLIRKKSD